MNNLDKNTGFKVVLIGNSSVGKTSLVHWLLFQNKTKYEVAPTIGASFSTKLIESNGKKINIQIWDTAGQERYRSISKLYYRGSAGCLCVFDLTNSDSFNDLDRWISDYTEINTSPHIIFLIGNKADCPEDKWAIKRDEIIKYANNKKCQCFFTNCVDGTNIVPVFETMAEQISNLNTNVADSNIVAPRHAPKKCNC